MNIIPKDQGNQYTPEGHDATVYSRSIVKECADIHVTTFPAGAGMAEEVHPEHTHLFYILEGCMTVLHDGSEIARLTPNDSLHIPAGEPHEIRNDTDSNMVFLAITYPKA